MTVGLSVAVDRSLDRLTGRPTMLGLGDVRPHPPLRLVTSRANGRRPTQLDDPKWLASRLERVGERAIAQELGCARGTVRAAIAHHGVPPRAGGRRRGATARRTSSVSAAELIADRIAEESRPRGPSPTLTLVAARVRALHDANQAGSRPATKDALISLASACGLALDHLHRLEDM